jgi:hypothetical protein
MRIIFQFEGGFLDGKVIAGDIEDEIRVRAWQERTTDYGCEDP